MNKGKTPQSPQPPGLALKECVIQNDSKFHTR